MPGCMGSGVHALAAVIEALPAEEPAVERQLEHQSTMLLAVAKQCHQMHWST